jgi:hypothetical protein
MPDNDADREDDHQTLKQRVVARIERTDNQFAEARPVEDDFCEYRIADERAEVEADNGDDAVELTVADLFVSVSDSTHAGRALPERRHVLVALRDAQLTVRMETAVISDDRPDVMPHLHGFEGNRDFGDVAIERAYAGRGCT